MLITPSRPQAGDWETLAGFLQVEEGGGKRRQGSQGDPLALSQHNGRNRIGVEGARPHPDRWHPAATSAERRSCSAASQGPPRAAPHRPACKAGGAGSPESASPHCARALETTAAPLARRGPHSPACEGHPRPARPLLPLGARSRGARADPRRARPLRVGPAGRGVQGRTEPEPDPAPPPDVTLAGVLSLPGLSFPLPKVCVCARACVCVGGRGGRVPPQPTTSPEPGRVEGAGGRGAAAADRPGGQARRTPARSRRTAAPFLSPTYLKIPPNQHPAKKQPGPTLPGPPKENSIPCGQSSSSRTRPQFAVTGQEGQATGSEKHCVRTAEVYSGTTPLRFPSRSHTILLGEKRAKDPGLEAAPLILLEDQRHQINTVRGLK